MADHDVLESIGSTPLVELRRIVGPGMARVLVKVEGANPTGSMKDRMARAAVLAAIADGRLAAGASVVEYTGGSTGTSLAFVCAALGHPLHIVTSDAFSQEKRDHQAALGARVTLVRSDRGRITEQLVRSMIAIAQGIGRDTGAWWFDQLNNADASSGYEGLATRSGPGLAIGGRVRAVGGDGSLAARRRGRPPSSTLRHPHRRGRAGGVADPERGADRRP